MSTSLLKRNLWIFKSGAWNFYSLPGYEISKYFPCEFSKKLLNFQIRLWKYVTFFWKIHKESILKFHNRENNKIPITVFENSKISFKQWTSQNGTNFCISSDLLRTLGLWLSGYNNHQPSQRSTIQHTYRKSTKNTDLDEIKSNTVSRGINYLSIPFIRRVPFGHIFCWGEKRSISLAWTAPSTERFHLWYFYSVISSPTPPNQNPGSSKRFSSL